MARDSVRVRVPEPEKARAPDLAMATEWERATAWERAPSGWGRRFHKLTLPWPQSSEIPLIAKSLERWTKCSPLLSLKGKFFSHPRGVHLVQRKRHTQTDERRGRPMRAGDQESVGGIAHNTWVATTVEADGPNSQERAAQKP